ncbi:MAG: 50S ribosomal protein L25/general stress protein Ctc [Dysgonamonadaceae bacterium]|jgi:large subunit ribosomal protein L25|nr:50S ribosomal protein L25/general stress protein Ctc [Dysgonamonadaceae bacterium]
MKTFELAGAARTGLGKKAAKTYRKEQSIPCVLYGGKEVVHFTVKTDSVRKLIYTPDIHLVNLTIDEKNYTTILKDAQFHPVSENILHMDFLEVVDNSPITMEVPVVLDGLAEGVKAGGKLVLEIRKLKVKALYTNIPEKLTINVEELGLGKTIQVGALSFDNLEILNAKNSVVCSVKMTRAARGAATKGE